MPHPHSPCHHHYKCPSLVSLKWRTGRNSTGYLEYGRDLEEGVSNKNHSNHAGKGLESELGLLEISQGHVLLCRKALVPCQYREHLSLINTIEFGLLLFLLLRKHVKFLRSPLFADFPSCFLPPWRKTLSFFDKANLSLFSFTVFY